MLEFLLGLRNGGARLGYGHLQYDRFVFPCFTAAALPEAAEAEVLDRWLGHMQEVKRRLDLVGSPREFHCSPAEERAIGPWSR